MKSKITLCIQTIYNEDEGRREEALMRALNLEIRWGEHGENSPSVAKVKIYLLIFKVKWSFLNRCKTFQIVHTVALAMEWLHKNGIPFLLSNWTQFITFNKDHQQSRKYISQTATRIIDVSSNSGFRKH